MKVWLALLIIIGGFIYLNRAYSHIYSTIGDQHLLPPAVKNNVDVISGNNHSVKHLTYVALGDSLTAGVGSSQNETILAYQIALGLSDKASSITLINLAHPGDTTREVISTQLDPAIQEQPDLVTVLIGVNDIHNFVSLDEFRKNYTQILERLKTTTAEIEVVNIPYLGSDLLLYPPYNIYFDLKTKQYNQVIKEVCQDENVKYIDLYTKSKSQFASNQKLYYASDQFHPSDAGYKLWGKLISED